jgi:hypothetical protein
VATPCEHSSTNPVEDAVSRFNVHTQLDATLAWYQGCIDDWHPRRDDA